MPRSIEVRLRSSGRTQDVSIDLEASYLPSKMERHPLFLPTMTSILPRSITPAQSANLNNPKIGTNWLGQ